VKSGRLYDGMDHPSQVENGEALTNVDDGFPYAQLFRVDVTEDH